MKVKISLLIGISVALLLFFKLHQGGKWNPHVIEVTSEQVASTGTETWRLCTFKTNTPIEAWKNDFVKVVLPNKEDKLFYLPQEALLHQIFLACTSTEVRFDKAALPAIEDGKLIKMCGESDECSVEGAVAGASYVNGFVAPTE